MAKWCPRTNCFRCLLIIRFLKLFSRDTKWWQRSMRFVGGARGTKIRWRTVERAAQRANRCGHSWPSRSSSSLSKIQKKKFLNKKIIFGAKIQKLIFFFKFEKFTHKYCCNFGIKCSSHIFCSLLRSPLPSASTGSLGPYIVPSPAVRFTWNSSNCCWISSRALARDLKNTFRNISAFSYSRCRMSSMSRATCSPTRGNSRG